MFFKSEKQIKKIIFILFIYFTPAISLSQQWKVVGLDAPSSNAFDYETYKIINSDEYEQIIPNIDVFRPKISVILSGGGARGFSHIGVLDAIEQHGIQIHSLVGTSMGAIIGSIYASGYTIDEIKNYFRDVDWEELFKLIENADRRDYILDKKSLFDKSLLKVYFKNFEAIIPQGLSFANKLNEILSNLLYNSKYISFGSYDELKIPFRAVATDIVKGNTVILKDKSLPLSVRASLTIPLRHTPVLINDKMLVDGGLMANLPVTVAIEEFSPDITIAVDATSPLLELKDLDRAWNLADQVVSIEMLKYTELERKKATFVITPNLQNYSNTNFLFLDSLIELGRDAFSIVADSLINEITKKTEENIDNYLKHKFPTNLTFKKILPINITPLDSFNLISILKANQSISIREIYKTLILSEEKYNKLVYKIADSNTIIIQSNKLNQINSIEISDEAPEPILKLINKLNYEYFAENVSIDLINRLVEDILSEARKNNYCFLTVDTVKWNEENRSLKFIIKPGTIEDIKIVGNESINSNLIQRELLFKKNEIAKYEKISSSRTNLMATSLFSFVDIYPQKNENGNINIIVSVAEAGNQIMQLGVRADNERNLQASLDFIHNNLWNLGLQLNFSVSGGSRNQNFSITGLNPKVLDADVTTKSMIYYDNRKYYIYQNLVDLTEKKLINNIVSENQWNKIGGLFSIGNQIGKNGKLSVDFRFEKFREFIIGNTPSNFLNLSTFKINFQYDSGDDLYYPSEGSLINIFLESNLIPDAKDFTSFSKIYISLSNYVSFHDRNTLNFGGIIGAGDQTMPITEMFWLGGENNFWGLSQDQYFGRQIAKFFFSYRYRVPVKSFFDMYFSIHYNTGRVWLNTSQIKMSSFLHGLGMSYSLSTPLGPLSFSIAKPMMVDQKLGVIWGETQTYFSFGVKF